MTVAGGILRGQVRTVRRKKKPGEGGGDEPEDPDGAARRKAADAAKLREAGLSAALAAALVGVSAATLRRWRRRLRAAQVLCGRRGPDRSRELSEEKRGEASKLARELRGLCGASALARAAGVSRRQAAHVKAEVVTELERERVARCTSMRCCCSTGHRAIRSTTASTNGRTASTRAGWRTPSPSTISSWNGCGAS